MDGVVGRFASDIRVAEAGHLRIPQRAAGLLVGQTPTQHLLDQGKSRAGGIEAGLVHRTLFDTKSRIYHSYNTLHEWSGVVLSFCGQAVFPILIILHVEGPVFY